MSGIEMQQATPEQEITYTQLCAFLRQHSGNLTPQQLLAMVANVLGKVLALQDQSTMTLNDAMEIINKNIIAGNKQALAAMMHIVGSA